jgi:hypothetical protein
MATTPTSEANQLLAIFSNLSRAKNYVGNSTVRIPGASMHQPSSSQSQKMHSTTYDPGDKILHLPIAREDKIIALFHETKVLLENGSVS